MNSRFVRERETPASKARLKCLPRKGQGLPGHKMQNSFLRHTGLKYGAAGLSIRVISVLEG